MDCVSLVLLNPAQTLRPGWKQGWPPLPGPQMFSEHNSAMVVEVVVVIVVVEVVLVVEVAVVVLVYVVVVVVVVAVVVLLNSSKSSVGHAPVSSSFSTQTPVALFRQGPDDPYAHFPLSQRPSIVVVAVVLVVVPLMPPPLGTLPFSQGTKFVPHSSVSLFPYPAQILSVVWMHGPMPNLHTSAPQCSLIVVVMVLVVAVAVVLV